MLDYVREFIVLAERLNFVRTADALHISQPTLTRHIACLEQELGFRLFNRNPMGLTEAGRSFFNAAGGVLDQLDAAIDQGRRIAAAQDERFVVNFLMSSNNRFADVIFEAMSVFQERFPYAPKPRLFQDHTLGVAESVLRGEADVGFVFTNPVNLPDGFKSEHLLDLPLMVYVHNENPLASCEEITVGDLRDCYLICPTNPYLRSTFDGAVETMKEHGVDPKYRVREIEEFDQISSTIRPDEILFKTAIGDTLVSPASFLAAKRFSDPVPEYHIYALYHEDARAGNSKNFVTTCKGVVRRRCGC